jgi:prepilin-type N-terminal cleavage/methylation domain-containing protein
MLEPVMQARQRRPSWRTGVTLIELMVVIALVAVVLTLVAPSFTRMIEMQRLRGVHDQLMTDIQFARSEAARLGTPVHIFVRNNSFGSSEACYTIFSDTTRARPWSQPCDCRYAAGQECKDSPATTTALRTVRVPLAHKINFSVVSNPFSNLWRMAYDPATGAMSPAAGMDLNALQPDRFEVHTSLDSPRKLAAIVSYSGRPTTCAPSGSAVKVPAC